MDQSDHWRELSWSDCVRLGLAGWVLRGYKSIKAGQERVNQWHKVLSDPPSIQQSQQVKTLSGREPIHKLSLTHFGLLCIEINTLDKEGWPHQYNNKTLLESIVLTVIIMSLYLFLNIYFWLKYFQVTQQVRSSKNPRNTGEEKVRSNNYLEKITEGQTAISCSWRYQCSFACSCYIIQNYIMFLWRSCVLMFQFPLSGEVTSFC